ncbi:hypothetical protein SALBM311S_03070 [Streptomyces alboniger]
MDIERVEDLWLAPQDHRGRAEILKAFTTAVTTAVSIVAVTLDPESVYFVGRLRPLVEEVLPEVRKRLAQTLPAVPRITTVSQVLGLSVARGAVHACSLTMTHNRLRHALLKARSQGPRQEQTAPAVIRTESMRNETPSAFAEELAARAAMAIDNARRYTREHALAVTLQRSVPRSMPDQSAVEVAHRYLPARAGVGGDWFDVIPLPRARVALVVGDVVGHGLHAAATMGRLRTAVRTFSCPAASARSVARSS